MPRNNEIKHNQQRQMDERAAWDQMAGHYDEWVMRNYREAYRLTIEKILEEASPASKVLEIACGTGIIAFGIAQHVASVSGIDLSPEMIAKAEEKLRASNAGNLTFRVADAYDLPFEDHSFDLVLITNMLYIVADPAAVLREAKRCLTPDGVLISVTDCLLESPPPSLRLKLLLRRLTGLPRQMKYVHYFHKEDLRTLYEENGIIIEREADLHSKPVNYYLSGKPG